MNQIIEKNLEAIKSICIDTKVERLYIFGSATTNDFTDKSDFDFLLEYPKDKEGLPAEGFDYFDTLFSLEKLLGRKVDLVAMDAMRNSYFIKSANDTKVLLYEKRAA